jgi:hypothetical protein
LTDFTLLREARSPIDPGQTRENFALRPELYPIAATVPTAITAIGLRQSMG